MKKNFLFFLSLLFINHAQASDFENFKIDKSYFPKKRNYSQAFPIDVAEENDEQSNRYKPTKRKTPNIYFTYLKRIFDSIEHVYNGHPTIWDLKWHILKDKEDRIKTGTALILEGLYEIVDQPEEFKILLNSHQIPFARGGQDQSLIQFLKQHDHSQKTQKELRQIIRGQFGNRFDRLLNNNENFFSFLNENDIPYQKQPGATKYQFVLDYLKTQKTENMTSKQLGTLLQNQFGEHVSTLVDDRRINLINFLSKHNIPYSKQPGATKYQFVLDYLKSPNTENMTAKHIGNLLKNQFGENVAKLVDNREINLKRFLNNHNIHYLKAHKYKKKKCPIYSDLIHFLQKGNYSQKTSKELKQSIRGQFGNRFDRLLNNNGNFFYFLKNSNIPYKKRDS